MCYIDIVHGTKGDLDLKTYKHLSRNFKTKRMHASSMYVVSNKETRKSGRIEKVKTVVACAFMSLNLMLFF